MKSILFLFAMGLASNPSDHTIYYSGMARWIPLHAPAVAEQSVPMLTKKEVLPSQGRMVETGTLTLKGQTQDSIFIMEVEGENLKVYNPDSSIVGTGTVHGPSWAWNRLQFSAVDQNHGLDIEDVNYITPDRLIARKTILRDGVPFMLFETDATVVSQEVYDQKYAEMHSGLAD